MSRETEESTGALQPDSQPSPPSGLVVPTGPETVRCSCGAQVSSDGLARGSCNVCGRFVTGNEAALRHGARRLRWTPGDNIRRLALRDAVLQDLGSVSAIQRELVEDFASACVLRDRLSEYLERVGALTEAGRRRGVLDAYLEASSRVARLASQIREHPATPSATFGNTRIERTIVEVDATPPSTLPLTQSERTAFLDNGEAPIVAPAFTLPSESEMETAAHNPASTTATPPPLPRSISGITEADIVESLEMLGDEMVAAYRDGTLSRDEALAIAGHRRKQLDELQSARRRR